MMAKVSAKGRMVESDINSAQYTTDTREDAITWYSEITGVSARNDGTICESRDGRYGFQLPVNDF